MDFSLYTFYTIKLHKKEILLINPSFQAINTREFCALALASFKGFYFDLLWGETSGFFIHLSP
jgi:hypothetical protein